MAYEYEEFLIKQFNEAYRAGNLKQINLIKELKEVYAKAKAWDKYLESTVRQEAIDEFGEDDPRVDYAVELTERLYREDK